MSLNTDQQHPPLLVIICGVTCGGKTTLARRLLRAYPDAVLLEQDAYFLPEDDPRHVPAPGVSGHANWDCEAALDMERLVEDVMRLLDGGWESREFGSVKADVEQGVVGLTESGEKAAADEDNLRHEAVSDRTDVRKSSPTDDGRLGDTKAIQTDGKLGADSSTTGRNPSTNLRRRLLIVEGFLAASDSRLRRRANLVWCLTLPRDICWERRQLRVYEPPDPTGYFDACVWPEYENALRRLKEAKQESGTPVQYISGEIPPDEVFGTLCEEVKRLMNDS